MKKVKVVVVAMAFGFLCSCSKSGGIEPVPLSDTPHKKDTVINNYVPHTLLRN